MKTLRTWLATMAVLLCCTTVSAQDFEVDGIYYNITSAADRTVEVTNPMIRDEVGYKTYYKGNITIPSTVTFNNIEFAVTTIGDYAFSPNGYPEGPNKDLISVTISEGIATIGDYAFYYCINLQTVKFPQSIEEIGIYAFSGCNSLVSFDAPKNLKTIGNFAFSDSPLTYAKFSNGVSFDYSAFSMLKICWLPTNGIVYIENFPRFNSNTKFILEYGMYYIDDYYGWVDNTFDYAMSGGWDTERIIMYDPTFTDAEIQTLLDTGGEVTVNGVKYSVTSLYGAFKLEVCGYEKGLTTADIASKITYLNREFTVTSIKGSAFANDSSLTTVKIPSTITSIGTDAFVGCTAITSVTTERATPLSINDGCFDAMAQLFATLNVPTGSLSAYQAADVWKGFGTITEVGVASNILTLTANEGGSIACGSTSVSNGTEFVSITSSSATITFTPDTYYTLTKVLVDGTDVTSQVSNGALPINMSADTKVVATFSANNEILISDEENFELANNISCDKITYTRTLPNLHWNALYLPFEVPVSQLVENYDVAYFNDVHSYDDDNDGTIDDMEMEVIKLTTGTLKANYPYLIRAKNEAAKELSIEVENTTLHKAEETTVSCTSVFMKFDITGTYKQMTADELDGSLVITTSGAWEQLNTTSTLKPFRLYLTLTTLDGSPVKVEETFDVDSPVVTIRVRGEEPGTTSIECEETSVKNEESDAPIYNLMGQPVKNPVKGHIYIQNGRKVVKN